MSRLVSGLKGDTCRKVIGREDRHVPITVQASVHSSSNEFFHPFVCQDFPVETPEAHSYKLWLEDR